MNDIKAILFDSGKVLNEPVTGHWFITPHFFDFVDRRIFETIEEKRLNMAFKMASNKIDEYNLVMNLDEEYRCFVEFYGIFSKELYELNLTKEDIENIAGDLVYSADKYTFYDDVEEVLNELKDKYKLAIVSDAWPSIYDVYDKNDLRKYFSSFVVSSLIGVCKPHRKMYETALEELGIKAEEALFVDDSLKNCKGAMELGFKAILLCRDYEDYIWCKENYKNEGVDIIHSLKEIEKMVR